MSHVPEFHFDFSAVTGMTFEDGAEVLFKQMEAHYNEHIQPKPYIFGADPAAAGGDRTVTQVRDTKTDTLISKDAIIMVEWEIKEGTAVGMKDGSFLTGISKNGNDIFDKIVRQDDNFIIGESGEYLLGEPS